MCSMCLQSSEASYACRVPIVFVEFLVLLYSLCMLSYACLLIVAQQLTVDTQNQEWIRESTQQHTRSIVLRCARVASLAVVL